MLVKEHFDWKYLADLCLHTQVYLIADVQTNEWMFKKKILDHFSSCASVVPPVWGRGREASSLLYEVTVVFLFMFLFMCIHNMHTEYCFVRILCRSHRDLFVSQLFSNCLFLGLSLNYSVYFINFRMGTLLIAAIIQELVY